MSCVIRIWRPGEMVMQRVSHSFIPSVLINHLRASSCLCAHGSHGNHAHIVGTLESRFGRSSKNPQNTRHFQTMPLRYQTLTTCRGRVPTQDRKTSDFIRSIKQSGSKHFPKNHIHRLRELRLAVKRGLHKNAVMRRERLTMSRQKMKEKMEGSFEKAKHLRENILTIPNLLTTSRIVLSPVLGYLVISEQYLLGTGLFIFTGLTDLLDGYIARNFKNQQSALGSIIDPLADKCLITILTVSLTVAELIPIPLTVLMFARDASLIAASSYLRYKSLEGPFTWSSYFNLTHVTMKFSPTFISKVNTAIQLFLVGVTLPAPVFHYVDHQFLHYLWYTTAATTFLSGMSYVFSRNTFKFFGKKKDGGKQTIETDKK